MSAPQPHVDRALDLILLAGINVDAAKLCDAAHRLEQAARHLRLAAELTDRAQGFGK